METVLRPLARSRLRQKHLANDAALAERKRQSEQQMMSGLAPKTDIGAPGLC